MSFLDDVLDDSALEPELVELPEHLGSTTRRLPHGVIRRAGRTERPALAGDESKRGTPAPIEVTS